MTLCVACKSEAFADEQALSLGSTVHSLQAQQPDQIWSELSYISNAVMTNGTGRDLGPEHRYKIQVACAPVTVAHLGCLVSAASTQ